ncbi:hypothetical protein E2562_023561 [Oryza meyeriana var. granulata]|uniref:Bowman-Birk serine protease inhibitors family domain-containing protein n=1 Tax=Oryza meyeriana var. granulata TaxID=110450 RepID=A0A6G1E131_9ORYZ|nr:hypothetical protein E2562_023561 [Oryza meyeriana var. granulata]
MERANILLMVSLGALLLAGISSSAIAGDVAAGNSNIRLPSDGGNVWPAAPPWECCDNLKQSPLRIWPPRFQCLDEVDRCAAACERCKKVDGSSSDDTTPRYVCQDWYRGLNPGSKSWPPTCRCLDKVESCSGGCGKCEQVESHPPRYRCLDRYHGFPGPKCH